MRTIIITSSIFLSASLWSPYRIQAQQPGVTPKNNLLTLTETSVNFGYHGTDWQFGNLDQVRKLVPPNDILAQLPEDLTGSKLYLYFYGSMPFSFHASLGYRISDSKGESFLNAPRFRLGISYRSCNMLPGVFTREVMTRIDTMMNPVTG
jgi:hypothetical protein